MNVEENETNQTARNKPQIRRKQDGGGGCTTPQLYGANTPSRKKLKNFKK